MCCVAVGGYPYDKTQLVFPSSICQKDLFIISCLNGENNREDAKWHHVTSSPGILTALYLTSKCLIGDPPSSCLVHLIFTVLLLFIGMTSSKGAFGSPAQEQQITISDINVQIEFFDFYINHIYGNCMYPCLCVASHL